MWVWPACVNPPQRKIMADFTAVTNESAAAQPTIKKTQSFVTTSVQVRCPLHALHHRRRCLCLVCCLASCNSCPPLLGHLLLIPSRRFPLTISFLAVDAGNLSCMHTSKSSLGRTPAVGWT